MKTSKLIGGRGMYVEYQFMCVRITVDISNCTGKDVFCYKILDLERVDFGCNEKKCNFNTYKLISESGIKKLSLRGEFHGSMEKTLQN